MGDLSLRILLYLIRGVIVGYFVFYYLSMLTGWPSLSIGLVFGLFSTMPFTTRRYLAYSLLLLSFILVLHYIHTMVFEWFNVYWELGVVLVSWIVLFWINVVERWRSRGD